VLVVLADPLATQGERGHTTTGSTHPNTPPRLQRLGRQVCLPEQKFSYVQ
jgi:hypothetical protein